MNENHLKEKDRVIYKEYSGTKVKLVGDRDYIVIDVERCSRYVLNKGADKL